jgi:aryl-phospho-beta-D-glucosidase BglC (GH1 family)
MTIHETGTGTATDAKLSRGEFLRYAALIAGAIAGNGVMSADVIADKTKPVNLAASEPSWRKLPEWHGFNLLSMYTAGNARPFDEWAFDFMAEHGFDFVRLPLDYKSWTSESGSYDESRLKWLDQAVQWGQSRGIHMCLNLHRAPGYCVNPPKEKLNLWDTGEAGEEARRQFASQWKMLSERFKGRSNRDVSFNLLNEPSDVSGTLYRDAVKPAVEAIRLVQPDRLIIADGRSWGGDVTPELDELELARATRGYYPMQISHYKASWMANSDTWSVPQWPLPASFNCFLYGTTQRDLQRPLTLRGSFAPGSEMTVRVGKVSNLADLVIKADGVTIIEKTLRAGAGTGEWKESTFQPQYGIYQALYDRDYVAKLGEEGAREISLELKAGDWLTINQITLTVSDGPRSKQVRLNPGDSTWGKKPATWDMDTTGNLRSSAKRDLSNKDILWTKHVEPWKEFTDEHKVGVMVGEWGAFNQTPHDVVLRWMSDCLSNFQKAGIGWALWNLNGSFGVLDSGRKDVTYEVWQGHKLDRRMLELLKSGSLVSAK